MKPRILPPLDVEKIITKITNSLVNSLRKGGLSVREVESWKDDKGICHITIENNGGASCNLSDDFHKFKNVELIHEEHCCGHFHWASGVYSPDYDSISFKIVR